MKILKKTRLILCLAALLFTAVPGLCSSYRVYHLGGYLGDENGGVNDKGQVVGWYSIDQVRQAVIAGADTPLTGLGTLGGYRASSYGADINNLGQATGYSRVRRGPDEAFFWDGSTMTGIGTLGSTYSRGWAINESGHIAGESRDSDNKLRAFFYDGQTMTDLGFLGDDGDRSLSRARAVNNTDVVAGYSQTIGSGNQAFVWDAVNGMQPLGTMGGQWSAAEGINDAGQIVGQAETADGNELAFLWDRGVMTSLGALSGHDRSWAADINNLGQAVGSSYAIENWDHPCAFLWEKGTMADLNDLIPSDSGWALEKAFGISDTGMIFGKGEYNNNPASFLLVPDPVPVPGAFLMLASGLLGLTGMYRRRMSRI